MFVRAIEGAADLHAVVTPCPERALQQARRATAGPLCGVPLLAIFNASVAITLQFARIVWATGRDRAWPEPISSWIGKVEPHRGAPWVATLFVGTLATILCFQSSLIAVVTFTAVLLVVLYGLIAISALVSRVKQRDLPRTSKMPFWPLPPIITLVGVVIALTQQKVSDLITVVVLFAVAAAYYFIFVAPRQGR